MSTEPRALWRYELEVDIALDAAVYAIKTAYYDREHDDHIADCWSEEVAQEIVRLHNEDVMRATGAR